MSKEEREEYYKKKREYERNKRNRMTQEKRIGFNKKTTYKYKKNLNIFF